MDGWQSPHHCGDNKFWYGSRQSIREVNYYEVFFAKYWDSYKLYEEGRFCHAINDHDNDFYILLKESTTTRIRLVAFSGLLFIKIDQSVDI